MDLVTFAFLALIALVSGGIAYFADWLGRKLGKKRLRLVGLRPKHTAAIGVVSSGFLISVVTIGLVYALSSDVRQWISKGRMAIRELNNAIAQRDAANAERQTITDQNSHLKADGARSQTQIAEAQQTLKSLNVRMIDLQKQIEANRVAATKLQGRLSEVQNQFIASTANLRSTEKEREQVQKSLTDIQNQYHRLKSTYGALAEQSREIKDDNTQLTNNNISLINSNQSLQVSNNELTSKRKDLEEKNLEEERSLDRLKVEIEDQTKELEAQSTALRLGEERQAKLDHLVDSSRERLLTFAVHEELARVSLPARLTHEEALQSITSLLRTAGTVAETRGAKTAAIFKHEDPKTQQEFQPQEIIDKMVRRIEGRPSEQVVVATSTYNAFQGEPVSIDLAAYPNPLVYKGGQMVAETRIDSSSSEETILSRVTDLLKEKVRARAKQDHLIPSADDSFGNVDGAQIFKIVKTVQSADGTVRLQAIARSNTRAGDPLQIDFRIR